MTDQVKKLAAQAFFAAAEGARADAAPRRPVLALTGLGNEHGEQTVLAGALAALPAARAVYIGRESSARLRCVRADTEREAHERMETLLAVGEIDGAVTMHYPFPVGVSTVGRVSTPGRGRAAYIATTTGMSAADRVEGIVKNTVYGLAAAKACGVERPTVGIVNVDGARQAERILRQMAQNGYPIAFAESERADGGCILRGNDLLTGAADVMAADPLTGNLLMKLLSAFNTGGCRETVGWGYGPGIGADWGKLVMIVSRASGEAVIRGALEYAAQLLAGDWRAAVKAELAAAEKAGLRRLLSECAKPPTALPQEIQPPPREVVTGSIPGVEIMDLEAAVTALWSAKIYAESGMGCTGPIVLVPEARLEECRRILINLRYLGD